MTRIIAHKLPPTEKDPRSPRFSPPVLLVFQNGSYFSYLMACFDHETETWNDMRDGCDLAEETARDDFMGWMDLPCAVRNDIGENVSISEEKPVSKAFIGYGISLGVGFDIHPDFYNWPRLYAEKVGHRNADELDQTTLNNIWSGAGVSLVYGGDGTSVRTTETIVVATPSLQKANELASIPIISRNMLVDPLWHNHLQEFFEKMGFEYSQPDWVLVASSS